MTVGRRPCSRRERRPQNGVCVGGHDQRENDDEGTGAPAREELARANCARNFHVAVYRIKRANCRAVFDELLPSPPGGDQADQHGGC